MNLNNKYKKGNKNERNQIKNKYRRFNRRVTR